MKPPPWGKEAVVTWSAMRSTFGSSTLSRIWSVPCRRCCGTNLEVSRPSKTITFAVDFLHQPQIANCHLLGLIKVAFMQCRTRGAKRFNSKQGEQWNRANLWIHSGSTANSPVMELIRNDCKFISEKISQLGLQITNEMESYRINIHSTTQDGSRHRKKDIVLCAEVCP